MTRLGTVSNPLRIWLHRSLMILLLPVLIVIGSTNAAAQSVTDGSTPAGLAPGTPAGSYALSDLDNISLFSGNLNFTVPLLKVGGRGEAQHTIMLPIESHWKNLYFFKHPAGFYYNPFPMYNLDLVTGIRPGYGPGVLVLRGAKMEPAPCGGGFSLNEIVSQTRLTFITPNGTEVELRDTNTDGAPLRYGCGLPPPPSRGTVFVSNDGTATTFISDTAIGEQFASSRELFGYLMLRDGSRSRIDNGLISWTRDRNGNQITYTYTNDRVTLIKDSLNREITIEYQQNEGSPYGVCDRIRYKGSGGVERIIRISYSLLSATFASGFAPLSKNQMFPPAIPDWVNDTPGMTEPFETNVISSIWLPDNRRYRFFYNSHAELARAELPTGGAYEYVWEDTQLMGYEDPYPQEILRRVKERRVFNGVSTEQQATYTYILPSTRTGNTTVTVDHFDGAQPAKALRQEKHFFFGTPIPPSFTYQTDLFTDSPWTSGREFQMDLLSASGATLLRRTTQTWRQRAPVTWCTGNPCTQDTAPPKDPRIVETIITLADTNQVSKVTSLDPADPTGQTVAFDQFNNKTDIWEYDFGVGQPGTFLRRTHFSYVTTSNYISASTDPSAGAHLRSLKSQIWVSSDPAGNNKRSLTVFEYDNYANDTRHKPLILRPSITSHGATYSGTFTVRGNATGTTSYINAQSQTGPVTNSAQYDIAGNVVATVDGVGNVATMTFSDSFCNGSTCGGTFIASTYAFVSATTSPIPDPAGQHGSSTVLSTSQMYDFWTGNPSSTTDANNQTTSFEYDDLLDRLTAIVRPTGAGRTDYEYGDAVGDLHLRTLTDLDAGRRIESRQYFDGLGRPIESRTYENSSEYISVKQIPFIMQQDPETSVWLSASQTSNPFRPLSEQPVWTTTFFDALGRSLKVRTPDNALTKTSYSGNVVTVTDPANKQRKSVTDALGRVKQVYEDPTNLNYLTSYEYDVLDNLTSVSQQDPVTLFTQTRSFDYDSLKRLTSATNRENGTVGYQYDQNNNLIVKTDARGVSTHYKYDNLNRLTRRWYNSSSLTTETVHNSPALPSDVGVTNEARLFYDSVSLPAGEPPNFNRGHAAGRLVAQLYGAGSAGEYFGYDAVGRAELKVQQLGGINYRITRSFNALGVVTAQTYPSQNSVSYNYDNVGRLADKDANNLAFTGSLGGVQKTYSRGIIYVPAGMKREQFGTDTAVYNKRFYNSRLQLAEMLVSTTSSDTSWDRGKIINDYSSLCSGAGCDGSDNNGNLVKQQHLIPGSSTQRQQQFEYDTLNRIKWVLETNGGVDQWRQWFKYDRWGNRTIDTTLEGSQTRTYGAGINNLAFEIEQSTNRLVAPGDLALTPNNRKMRYDDAGNLVNDHWSSHGSATPGEFTRKYDGDNRMVSAKDDTGGTSLYSYDASGARVRRQKGTVETWQVYGFDGELLAEYAANEANSPQKEYGYRNGELFVTAESSSLGAASPSNVMATPPSSGSSISLSWNAASGATNYRVERKPANGDFTLAGTTLSTTFVDNGTSSGNAYLFRVCAANGAGQCLSTFSNIALGTAVTFTDPTLVSIVDDPTGITVTSAKAAHINELRAAVTAVRSLAGLLPPTWTYQNIANGNSIHVEDVRELRIQLGEALTALGIQTPDYTDPILKGFIEDPLNATLIKAVHIRQLRERVRSGIGGSAGGGGGSTFRIYWLVTDHLGTARMLIDQTGSLENMKRHDYLPFGEELFQGTGGRTQGQGYDCSPGQPGCTSSPDNVRQQFTQKERDVETGLDYFGARYFASTQGRFTSPDPIYFQAEMPRDPQRFNLYAYTRNNPLKFIDPEGEAIELSGNEEERKRQLEALRSTVGQQAGTYLYENKGKDGKYYVGVYTNGPTGKGKDFKDLNDVAGELAPIIADEKVAVLEIVAVGTVIESGGARYTLTPSESCNCIAAGSEGAAAITMPGADQSHFRILLPMASKGSALDKAGIDPIDPVQMEDGRPGYNDWGIVLGHELGHARARMTRDPRSNDASLRLENKVRKLRDKKAPTRDYHSTREALAP